MRSRTGVVATQHCAQFLHPPTPGRARYTDHQDGRAPGTRPGHVSPPAASASTSSAMLTRGTSESRLARSESCFLTRMHVPNGASSRVSYLRARVLPSAAIGHIFTDTYVCTYLRVMSAPDSPTAALPLSCASSRKQTHFRHPCSSAENLAFRRCALAGSSQRISSHAP